MGEKQEKNLKGLLIPKEDVVFQALFGTKGSEKILSGLLSKILGEPVEDISLEANQNLIREVPDQKLGILDLRANIGKKAMVNIEVQLVDEHNLPERLLYYWARIYGGQLKEGENYSKLKKTIAILIANYDIPKLKWFKDAHTKWVLSEKRNPNIIIFENIEIHIVEMPKILKYPEDTEKGLNAWIEFLSNPESEMVDMAKKKDTNLKKAFEKLEFISGDEDLRRIAELKRKYVLDQNSMLEYAQEEGKKVGKEIGEKSGEKRAKRDTAKKLLELGVDIDKIIIATGLTKEEIEKLLKE